MKIFLSLLMLFFVTFITACTNLEEKPFTPPDITFENYLPIVIDVKEIQVYNNYKSPLKEPNVEYLFHNPPYVAAEHLVKRRLVAIGSQNILRISIDDASVIREFLPIDISFWGNFKIEPIEKLKAKVVLRFEMVKGTAPDEVISSGAEVVATREKTLMEGISLSERDKVYFQLTEGLMADINKGLQNIIRESFGAEGF